MTDLFPRQAFDRFLGKLTIDSKEKGRMRLADLLGSQRKFLSEVEKGYNNGVRFFVVLKGRQLGVTTISTALDLFWQMRHPGMTSAMVSDDESNREYFRLLIDQYLRTLPRAFRVSPRVHNRNQLVLMNGSRITYLVAGTRKKATLGQGKGINFCHGTEVSSWGDPEGFQSLMASLAENHPNRLYVFESPLALDTPVPTPFGWSSIGEIKPGDIVYDDDGNETEVMGVSPVFTGRRCFELRFSTGDIIVSDAGHKWRVERMGSSVGRWKSMEVTTSQLDPARDRIWMGKPLCGREGELPVDPYFLGVWLGDGHNEAIRITCGDIDMGPMRDNLRRRGVKPGPITPFRGRPGGVFGIHGLMQVFRDLNLINNKHIPAIYLRADLESRLQLLRGLMDTDGTIAKDSASCTFTNGCRPLIDSCCELLSSLGIRYSILWVEPGEKRFSNGKTYSCEPYAMVHFSAPTDFDVFSLPRKLAHQKRANSQKRKPRRYGRASIISMREVQSVPVKCISVDAPSHLFRVGRTMLTTHNTAKGLNHFHDLWQTACRARFMHPIFIGWWTKEDYAFPEGSPAYKTYWTGKLLPEERDWIKDIKRLYQFDIRPEQVAWWRYQLFEKFQGDEGMLMQEHAPTAELAFQLTGDQFFPAAPLVSLERMAEERLPDQFHYDIGHEFYETRLIEAAEGELKVWDAPVDGATYVIGADSAYGSSEWKDNFAIEVCRCYADGLEQVAEYLTPRCSMTAFAWIIAHLAGAYKNSTVIMEVNGSGRGVLDELNKLPFKMASLEADKGMTGLADVLGNMRHYIYRRPDSLGGNAMLQWSTNQATKLQAMNGLKDAVVMGVLQVRSQDFIEQAKGIIQDGAFIGAEGRGKDDAIIAMALAVEAWKAQVQVELMEAGRTREHESRETMPRTPLNWVVEDFMQRLKMEGE